MALVLGIIALVREAAGRSMMAFAQGVYHAACQRSLNLRIKGAANGSMMDRERTGDGSVMTKSPPLYNI